MNNPVKIKFCDYWDGFDPKADALYRLISQHRNVVLSDDDPDYVIYSVFGFEFLKHDCVRIFYTGENVRPDFNLCDYAIGFDDFTFGDRNFRWPNFMEYEDQISELATRAPLSAEAARGRAKFCNFLYSNSRADPIRDRFFHALNAVKHVDSAGRHLNNMPKAVGDRYAQDWTTSKIPFMAQYKFSIAFENTASPGYTTEKLMHALLARTVPIYWGSDTASLDFNPAAFIQCRDEQDFDDVIRRVQTLDADEDAYLEVLNQPAFTNGALEKMSTRRLAAFLQNIFDQPLETARRRPRYGSTQVYEKNMRRLLDGPSGAKGVARSVRDLFRGARSRFS